jgi:Zn-dependent protease with chaperone function
VIFAARGLLVSLAFFAMVYCPLSLLTVLAWRGVERVRREPAWRAANLLFGLRILPFAVSAVVTLLFTFPSFWLMERSSPDEDAATFALAGCSLIILSAGLFRVLRIHARTTRAVVQWQARATSTGNDAHSLRSSNGAPPLILVGIRRPRVMVSDAAAAVLSDAELQVAVRHEIGHARAWDNLKKVLVSSTPFPGMDRLEQAWQEAAELAADDRAVANRQDALNLAAALIKLSRSSGQAPEPVLATGLVSGASSISLRVGRLLRWRGSRRPFQFAWPWALLVLLTMVVGISVNYGATLVLTHRLTELLVP